MNRRKFLSKIPFLVALPFIKFKGPDVKNSDAWVLKINGETILYSKLHLSIVKDRRLQVKTTSLLFNDEYSHLNEEFDIDFDNKSNKWILRSYQYDVHNNKTYNFQDKDSYLKQNLYTPLQV